MLLICYSIFFSACSHKLAPAAGVFNQEVRDQRGTPQLLGKCTRAGLEKPPYNSWFDKNYSNYTVDSITADRLRVSLKGKKLRIFMGTWCGDSQREVPRLFKLLDCCGIDSSAVQLIMVSNTDSMYKQSPGHEEKGMDIFRVPDILVYNQGKELGRIVESPVQSLEKDLLLISQGQPYTPHYPGAGYLIHVFKEEKLEQIEQDLPGLAARIRPLVGSPSELAVYAHVMRVGGQPERASIALRINALLFPDQK
jgi:hypothetical protein